MTNIIIYTDGDTKPVIEKIAKKLNCDADCIYPVSKKKSERYMAYDNIFMCFTRDTYYSSSLDDFCEENENLFLKCVPIIICYNSKSEGECLKTVRYISNVMENFDISEKVITVVLENGGSEMIKTNLSQFDLDVVQFDDITTEMIGHPIILLLNQKTPCFTDLPFLC